MQVRGEVTVAQIEPRRFAESDYLSERAEALAAEPPAPGLVDPAAQRVADGVEVGRDVEPPDERIVTRVADDGKRPRRDERVQAPQELGGAGPTGKGDDAHGAAG